jgi:glyoxylase-like metal-dependent hydrolase (beta-lactamase superfamily II)
MVNVYLFRAPEPILIDAGYQCPEGWARLQHALAEQGLAVRDLTRVIITHPHVDHYGLAARIAAESQATICMANVGVHWLQRFPELWSQRIAYYQETFLPGLGLPAEAVARFMQWMIRALAAWEPIAPERIVAFPTVQPLHFAGADWQVLNLPGHDSHQTCFYQADTRQLLSADLLMIPTATPVVEAPAPGHARIPALPLFVQSLDRLAALEVAMVYPGHGAPFTNHRTVIQAQQARIQQRKEECLRHLVAGATTVLALFERLYGPRIAEVGLAGLWMVVGYLDLLTAEGRAAMEPINGVWHYRALPAPRVAM